MSPQESLPQSLAALEQLIDAVGAALLAADPSAVEKHSTALRAAAARLAPPGPSAAALPAPLQQRVAAIGARLRLQREALARLAALTDQQLAGLLPRSAATPTYGAGWGHARSQHRANGTG